MKIRTLILALVAVAAAASCSVEPTGVTEIRGKIKDPEAQKVRIFIPSMKMDTTILLGKNGVFAVDIPANVTACGTISANKYRTGFVPDGTKLNVRFASSRAKMKSSYKESLAMKYIHLVDTLTTVQDKALSEYREAIAVQGLTKAQKDSLVAAKTDVVYDEMVEVARRYIRENPDNVLSITAFDAISSLVSPQERDALYATISPSVKESRRAAERRR